MLQVELVVGAVSKPPNFQVTPASHDFAWRVHSALDSWTGKVDTKASISLAIESATFGFVVTLAKQGEWFSDLGGVALIFHRIGVGVLLAAVLLAVLVVIPQLDRRKSKRNWRSNMIYFGHLRHWHPKELARALNQEQLYNEQLAEQLVAMAKIAWRKHAVLQWSLALFVCGAGCLVIAGLVR